MIDVNKMDVKKLSPEQLAKLVEIARGLLADETFELRLDYLEYLNLDKLIEDAMLYFKAKKADRDTINIFAGIKVKLYTEMQKRLVDKLQTGVALKLGEMAKEQGENDA